MKGETPPPPATPENPACTASPAASPSGACAQGRAPPLFCETPTQRSPRALRVTMTRAVCAPGLAQPLLVGGTWGCLRDGRSPPHPRESPPWPPADLSLPGARKRSRPRAQRGEAPFGCVRPRKGSEGGGEPCTVGPQARAARGLGASGGGRLAGAGSSAPRGPR